MQLPKGFGVVRALDTGHASHERVHEHEYSPVPIRHFSTTTPPDQDCGDTLRPAVRKCKVAFSYFGARVPLTADHARCWLGQILLDEVRRARLRNVELVVPSLEELNSLLVQGQSLELHGNLPTWVWHTWPHLPDEADGDLQEPGQHTPSGAALVVVAMSTSPYLGVQIKLVSQDLAAKAHVFRTLRQFCDEVDACDWHPLPDTHAKITKVMPRSLDADQMRLRVAFGQRGPFQGGDGVCPRAVNDLARAQARVAKALSTAREAHLRGADAAQHLDCLREVSSAFREADDMKQPPRPEWLPLAAEVLSTSLRRLLDEQDSSKLEEAREICIRLNHELGILLPECLAEAESVLGPPGTPLRGEALILRRELQA